MILVIQATSCLSTRPEALKMKRSPATREGIEAPRKSSLELDFIGPAPPSQDWSPERDQPYVQAFDLRLRRIYSNGLSGLLTASGGEEPESRFIA